MAKQDRPKWAFELRSEFKDSFDGGSVALGDGSLLDVAAELKKGGGKIVTDNEQTATTLEAYEPLKAAPVPEKKAAAKKPNGKG